MLTDNRGLLPELLVQPEGLEADSKPALPTRDCCEDPLLQLFNGEPLSVEDFQAALRQQRAVPILPAEKIPVEAAGAG